MQHSTDAKRACLPLAPLAEPAAGRPFSVGACALEPGSFDPTDLGFPDPEANVLAGRAPVAANKTGAPETLRFVDTVLNRATVRAYRACLANVETYMRASVAKYKDHIATLHDSIALWNQTWRMLVDQLDLA